LLARCGHASLAINTTRSIDHHDIARNLQLQRKPILKEFAADITSIAHDPVFYAIIGGLSAAPTVLKNEDPEINEMLAGEDGTADMLFDPGDFIGSGVIEFSASVAAYTAGKLFHSQKTAAFGSDLFRAEVLNAVATVGLKHALGRTRPDGGSYAFPSGHSSTSYTAAAVVYSHFGAKWGIPAYALATYVGVSRLQENRHYPSDVLAGALLGSYIGFKISGRDRANHSLLISPSYSQGAVGATVSLRF
jgi:membrane-associated phospholipid phosphatase